LGIATSEENHVDAAVLCTIQCGVEIKGFVADAVAINNGSAFGGGEPDKNVGHAVAQDGAVVNHGKATQLHDVHGMVDSVGNAVFIVSQHLKYRVMAGIGKFIAPRSRRYLRDPGIVVDFAVAMLAPLLE